MFGYNPAINGLGNMQYNLGNTYSTYAGLGDLSDTTLMGTNPVYNLNSYSSYGSGLGTGMFGGMGMGMMGGMGMYGGMGMMGYGPGSEVMGMSQADYQKYQEQMENYGINKQIRQGHLMEYAKFQQTAAENAVTKHIGTLQRTIAKNDQDNVSGQYGALVSSIQEKYKEATGREISGEQANAEAQKVYFEATGQTLADASRQYGDGYFIQGLKQGVLGFGLFGIGNRTNEGENRAAMVGDPISNYDLAMRWAGRGIAGGASLFALYEGYKHRGQMFSGIRNAQANFRMSRAEHQLSTAERKLADAKRLNPDLKINESFITNAKNGLADAKVSQATKLAETAAVRSENLIGRLLKGLSKIRA
jgi:hypothetical protein